MKKTNFFFTYGLIFLATFAILQFFQGEPPQDPVLSSSDIGIEAVRNSYAIGKDIKIRIQNNTEETLELYEDLSHPIGVLRFNSNGFESVNRATEPVDETPIEVTTIEEPITEHFMSELWLSLEPGQKKTVSLGDHSYSWFGEEGIYKVALEYEENNYESPEFDIRRPSLITRAWRTLIYNPILNALVGIIVLLPGNQLFLAVIILTVIIRTLLLAPSLKAIRAQKNMQAIQPKLEALKKKYADDQARLAQETMLLWKQNKVNPLSSCLPLLIQFPVLIALFYVMQNGLSPDRGELLYPFLSHFSLADIDPMFLGFNLLVPSVIVFPVAIGLLQFTQMQLMTAKRSKKKENKNTPNEVETANRMMKYVMPAMIAFFTSQLPAAVGLYWGTSTFYGIIQQLVVNKEGSTPSATTNNTDEVKIKVIKKNTT